MKTDYDIIKLDFLSLDKYTQHNIICNWIKNSEFEEVFKRIDFIDYKKTVADSSTRMPINEWLLTNPDERAFELWKMLRAKAKKECLYYAGDWSNSAVIVMRHNLHKRLDFLDSEEIVFYFDFFLDRINKDDILSINYIINIKPDYLTEENVFSNEKREEFSMNALIYALANDKTSVAKLLLWRGAEISSIKSALSCSPFLDSKESGNFVINAEHLLLNEQIKNKNNEYNTTQTNAL